MTITELYELDGDMAKAMSKFVVRRDRFMRNRKVDFVSEIRVNTEFHEILEEAVNLKNLYEIILLTGDEKILSSEAYEIACTRKEEGKTDGLGKWYELFP